MWTFSDWGRLSSLECWHVRQLARRCFLIRAGEGGDTPLWGSRVAVRPVLLSGQVTTLFSVNSIVTKWQLRIQTSRVKPAPRNALPLWLPDGSEWSPELGSLASPASPSPSVSISLLNKSTVSWENMPPLPPQPAMTSCYHTLRNTEVLSPEICILFRSLRSGWFRRWTQLGEYWSILKIFSE